MELWDQELVVSHDSLVDMSLMLFGAMVYHWWMIMLLMVSLT
jgi:hypothetical protein